MRKRFQNGSVKKSRDGRYWLGSWREDDGHGRRKQRTRILGKIGKMTKSKADAEMAKIVRPINGRVALGAPPDVTMNDFVEKVYFPFYCRKWKRLTAESRTGSIRHRAALPSGLQQDLKLWLSSSPDTGGEGWLFPSEKLTTPIGSENMLNRYIRPRLKTVGLEWVEFRVMRRTHSSLMNEKGVNPKLIADQQGHGVDVNLNVYTQSSVESRIEALPKLESAFIN